MWTLLEFNEEPFGAQNDRRNFGERAFWRAHPAPEKVR
jgi:hypothetical protein